MIVERERGREVGEAVGRGRNREARGREAEREEKQEGRERNREARGKACQKKWGEWEGGSMQTKAEKGDAGEGSERK